MSYLSDITFPLIKTLRHFASLPTHQLAGHCANLEFWTSEVEHRKNAIESYRIRFERMKTARQDYGETHGFGAETQFSSYLDQDVQTPLKSEAPLRENFTDIERKQLIEELDSAFSLFSDRLKREGLQGELSRAEGGSKTKVKRESITDQIGEFIGFFEPHCSDTETLQKLKTLLPDTRMWTTAHKLFQKIRNKNLIAIDSGNTSLEIQYAFEEICAKTIYNLSDGAADAPFDADSPYWVIPCAIALAEDLNIEVEKILTIIR